MLVQTYFQQWGVHVAICLPSSVKAKQAVNQLFKFIRQMGQLSFTFTHAQQAVMPLYYLRPWGYRRFGGPFLSSQYAMVNSIQWTATNKSALLISIDVFVNHRFAYSV